MHHFVKITWKIIWKNLQIPWLKGNSYWNLFQALDSRSGNPCEVFCNWANFIVWFWPPFWTLYCPCVNQKVVPWEVTMKNLTKGNPCIKKRYNLDNDKKKSKQCIAIIEAHLPLPPKHDLRRPVTYLHIYKKNIKCQQ